MSSDKAWGGRFDADLDATAARFSASVDTDKRLALEDIAGSLAHARMLASRAVISAADLADIERGLAEIRAEIEAGTFEWDAAREDVHMNIEAALTAKVGDAGARLHTGRSRNDQVATDLRLFARESCLRTARRIDALESVLVERAREHVDTLLPGYTHLQRAQPIRLAHHLHAWVEMLDRDAARLRDAARRMNESPLGSGALAGTTFPLDREMTARELGFDRPAANSLDATADRDFLVESAAALATCAIHLSRFGEELVLWSSQEFGFVEMSDAFATGSSMMPQKKNPDIAELIRGKSARVVGDLVTLLVLQKGLPLAYNRDLQEDKPPLFDAFDTVESSLAVMTGMMATVRFRADRMAAALREGFVTATEVADWLVTRGVPFREAHAVAGRLVRIALERGSDLVSLPLDVFRREHASFDDSIYVALDPAVAVERRDLLGAPARARVLAALDAAEARLDARRPGIGAADGQGRA
ncbi:MAG: argininosuccinate lyase [Deltaproteobacteria bacterium]|nr:argininosuccinate lyase [Deltaproteobacteria bacterium]